MLKIENLTVQYPLPDASWSCLLRRGIDKVFFGKSQATIVPRVLDGLSLRLDEGEFLVVLGASGSGKSTLLKSIAGLVDPQAGSIVYQGEELRAVPPHRRPLSMVFQSGGWYDHLTVEQHFRNAQHRPAETEGWLQQLELTAERHLFPSQLSGGQAQRLAIGRALMRQHPLLLMDEPLSHLDQPVRETLRSWLKDLHRQGRTILYVTHDQQDAWLMATRIAVLDRGRIVQQGTPTDVYANPIHKVVAELLGQPRMNFLPPEQLRSSSVAMPTSSGLGSPAKGIDVGVRPEAWSVEGPVEAAGDPLAASDAGPDIRLSPPAGIELVATLVEKRQVANQLWLDFQPTHTGKTLQEPIRVVVPLRSPSEWPLRRLYHLKAAASDVHFFDREQGSRLGL